MRIWSLLLFGILSLLWEGCGGKSTSKKSTSSHATTPAKSSPPLESKPPTLSTSLLTFSNLTSTSVQLIWEPANDSVTPAAQLIYTVYASTSYLATQGEWLAASTVRKLTSPTTNLGALSVEGLAPSSTYYFEIFVANEAGDITLYEVGSITTEAAGTDPNPPDTTVVETASITETTTVTNISVPLTLTVTFTDTVSTTATSTQVATQTTTLETTVTQTVTTTSCPYDSTNSQHRCDDGYGFQSVACFCIQCPANYYSDGTPPRCLSCTPGTISTPGSISCVAN